MIFYTADLHFGHANIIKHCDRPFADASEMDEVLIANWNMQVTNGDTVYIAGDLMFRIAGAPSAYLDRLKGKKHLIIGNHDSSWMKKAELSRYFESVAYMTVINNGKCRVTLCHYPMMTFDSSYLIYGHIHNNTNNNYWPLLKTMENALNAGVEVNGYQPVSFEELIANNIVFREG
jgi:calcineurin-like phosphoesterase family protein